jgi:hypothetical protein
VARLTPASRAIASTVVAPMPSRSMHVYAESTIRWRAGELA